MISHSHQNLLKNAAAKTRTAETAAWRRRINPRPSRICAATINPANEKPAPIKSRSPARKELRISTA